MDEDPLSASEVSRPLSEGFGALLRAVAQAPEVEPELTLVADQIVEDTYRVRRRLGAGGMGVVYLAEHLELRRDVALKIHKPAVTEGLDRLLDEARVMARLNDPNVVTVYDVGRVEGGVYIAMEFVDGGTAREWLAKPRSPTQILELFIEAGKGLAAAHAVGIVHRDFKPENILVGRDRRVRVADFGIARGIGLDETEKTDVGWPLSRDELAGTPAYMAPEQLRGADLDARVDQFAFCVAVYESLYGDRPFGGDTIRALLTEIEARKLRRPSSSRVPRWVWPVLRRGLDPEPSERFARMRDLLHALSPAIRSRRRRLAVGAVAITGLGVGAWLFWPGQACTDSAAALESAWGDAKRELVVAQFAQIESGAAAALGARVVDALDGYADGWIRVHRTACEATRIKRERSERALDAQMACLHRAKEHFGALVGVFEGADASVLQHGLTAAMRVPATAACERIDVLLADDRRTAPTDDPQVAELRRTLAYLRALVSTGKFVEARGDIEVALQQAEDLDDDVSLVEGLYLRGDIETQLGEHDAAEATYRECSRLAYAAGLDDYVGLSMASLAWLAARKPERLDEGLEAAALAEAAVDRMGGAHRIAGELAVTRADLLRRAERYEEAEAQLDVALEHFGHLDERADYYAYRVESSRGTMYGQRRDYARARAAFQAAYDYAVSGLGAEHPLTAGALANLATSLHFAGETVQAAVKLREAIAIKTRVYGEGSPEIAQALNNLAVMLQFTGDKEGALAAFRQAYAIDESGGPETLGRKAMVVFNMANLNLELGNLEEATKLARDSVDAHRAAFGQRHTEVARAVLLHGIVEAEHERYEQADKLLREALEMAIETQGGDEHHLVTIEPRLQLARLELKQGAPDAAAPLAATAKADAEKPGVPPWHGPEAGYVLAQIRWAQGRKDEARSLARRSQADLAKLRDTQPALAHDIDAWLAEHQR